MVSDLLDMAGIAEVSNMIKHPIWNEIIDMSEYVQTHDMLVYRLNVDELPT